jgi:hypothetical protein
MLTKVSLKLKHLKGNNIWDGKERLGGSSHNGFGSNKIMKDDDNFV